MFLRSVFTDTNSIIFFLYAIIFSWVTTFYAVVTNLEYVAKIGD